MSKPTVLVVDDEPDLVELVSLTLNRMNLDTQSAGDVAGARALLRSGQFDLCLTDMRLPDGDGLDLVAWIQENRPTLPVAVITAHGNVEAAVRALKLGAFDFVSKPLDLGVLRKLVASAIRLGAGNGGTGSGGASGVVGASESASDALPRNSELVGASAAMDAVRSLIGRVARSQAPVYISGESGVGKELVARLVHLSGPRRGGPFVPVNCGAIPSELMESELFGHKRGSFTGAIADSKGLVQSAEGGTLFLDEVADLPLHLQVKLLRVIQEKTVRPVGESRELTVDVRILSATHKDLTRLVAQGRFREDLYYRINVIELRVPPLRERAEDIADLAIAIVDRLARRMHIEAPSLSDDALAMLEAYPFPGNVRELENVLERAMTLCDSGIIGPSNIQLRDVALHRDAEPAFETAMPEAARVAASPLPPEGLGAQLETVERAAILRALEQSRYNKTAAAKALGMTFRALRYRIKKLGIE